MLNPRHIAIIMDGNGRWAQMRGLPRAAGHRAGMDVLRQIVDHADSIKLEWLTLFAFSSENWARPQQEVESLMGLLKLFVRRDLHTLHGNNVRIKVIGEKSNLPRTIALLLAEAETLTQHNTGLTLVFAFNYGGREEIIRATKAIVTRALEGQIGVQDISPALFTEQLYCPSMPDPDLIIRTSGEMRLSNFLLWQSAYSEFYFSECNWPDFSVQKFDEALHYYAMRDRRFGKVETQMK